MRDSPNRSYIVRFPWSEAEVGRARGWSPRAIDAMSLSEHWQASEVVVLHAYTAPHLLLAYGADAFWTGSDVPGRQKRDPIAGPCTPEALDTINQMLFPGGSYPHPNRSGVPEQLFATVTISTSPKLGWVAHIVHRHGTRDVWHQDLQVVWQSVKGAIDKLEAL